jgi:membrane protein
MTAEQPQSAPPHDTAAQEWRPRPPRAGDTSPRRAPPEGARPADARTARSSRTGRALGGAWSFARQTVTDFLAESPFQLAAALSFYTLLSLSPLLLVVVSTAGFLWEKDAVRRQLLDQIQQLVGRSGAEAIETVLANLVEPEKNLVSLVVGVVTALFGASAVFAQLQTSLNHMWNVKTVATRRVLWGLVRTRLLSLALVVTVGFVLLVSLVLSAALAALHGYLSGLMPRGGVLWQGVNLALSLLVIGLLIGVIYRVLPDVRLGWRYVWLGAFFTAALFAVGKFLIGLYLGHASIGSAYGAAGSLVVFLVWVYYSSLILFLGAEITQVYARRRGAWVEPVEHAVEAEPEGERRD